MKAIILTKPKTLKLLEIPEPKLLEKNHVLIKVKACGICGSDLRYWEGDNPWSLHTLGRHIDNPPNMVLGHEFAGEVVKVNHTEYESLLGKRVGVQSYRICGKCQFCQTGRENLCRDMIHIGHAQGWGKMDYYPGAYGEYCLGWADLLHPIPEYISFAEAAMGDILCVAVHVNNRAKIYPGATILCVGGGPIGLSTAQVAKTIGADKIIISDPSPIAQKVIQSYGEFITHDPSRIDLKNFLKTYANKTKFTAIFDSVGSSQTMKMAITLLEEGGTYINLAVHHTPVSINALLLGSERTITTSSNAFYSDLKKAFDLINSRKIDVKPWITHRLPLEKFQTAFDLLFQHPKAAYKVIFEP